MLFDPKLDVAILRVEHDLGPVLNLLGHEVERGAKGAVIGYPENGPLTFGKAAVRSVIPNKRPDIYGKGEVSRRVYELQAVIRPGNSGGPFVLVDGDVAGIVFAASTTNDNIGYALTVHGVRERAEPGATRFTDGRHRALHLTWRPASSSFGLSRLAVRVARMLLERRGAELVVLAEEEPGGLAHRLPPGIE